ncbi:hypothetical protein MRB53_039486 [Persea americana]|nr:hypothetical protein MRB53_039486 [Persea americana]
MITSGPPGTRGQVDSFASFLCGVASSLRRQQYLVISSLLYPRMIRNYPMGRISMPVPQYRKAAAECDDIYATACTDMQNLFRSHPLTFPTFPSRQGISLCSIRRSQCAVSHL